MVGPEAVTNARTPPLLRPRPPVNLYPPLLALDDRRLRLLAMWESEEALKLARAAGVKVPR